MTQPSVCRQRVVVNLDNGLHLVPCSQIARTSRRFSCDLRIVNGDTTADSKNVLDLMQLSAIKGTELDIEAVGDDAAEAIEELIALFDSNFDEP